MERVTSKHKDCNGDKFYEYNAGDGYIYAGKAVYKLGELEDIEEELGMGLLKIYDLYKRLQAANKYYYKCDNGEIITQNIGDWQVVISLEDKEFWLIYYEPVDSLAFNEYGVKWAFTEEELR